MKRKGSCGLVFANPNAPTGTYLPLEDIRYLLENYPPEKPVLIDEAYIDFGGESAVSLLRDHKNLSLVRTFSKSMSLAGVRLGFRAGRQRTDRCSHHGEGLFQLLSGEHAHPENR